MPRAHFPPGELEKLVRLLGARLAGSGAAEELATLLSGGSSTRSSSGEGRSVAVHVVFAPGLLRSFGFTSPCLSVFPSGFVIEGASSAPSSLVLATTATAVNSSAVPVSSVFTSVWTPSSFATEPLRTSVAPGATSFTSSRIASTFTR